MFIRQNSFCVFLLIGMLACSQEEEVIVQKTTFGFVKPVHFPEPVHDFAQDPITEEGFELGKMLFNDPILSRDSTISCASCHDQTAAFADPQHRLSIGIEGRVGIRNSPPIQNMAFMKEFFWVGGVVHLDFVPPNAITSPFEMDDSISNVIQKLRNSEKYNELFVKAFGESSESINSARMLKALSQFMLMMVSSNSKYDQFLMQKTQLNEHELEGMKLFKSKCANCHSGELFSDQSYRNNGLDTVFTDRGREIITEKETDKGKFRVPSLRNVELTDPYMHDGRFGTLEQVLSHYAHGVKNSPTLDPSLVGEKPGIEMTVEQQERIVIFLKTLTDKEFVQNEIFLLQPH